MEAARLSLFRKRFVMGLFDWFRRKEEPTGPWKIGDRVMGEWGPQRVLFPGIIDGFKNGRYHVRFDDGDKAWLSAEQIVKLELKIGSRVMGRCRGGPHFFAGTIDRLQGERIHIHYDEGDQESRRLTMVGGPPIPH